MSHSEETYEKNSINSDYIIDYENLSRCELCSDIVVFTSVTSKIKHLINIHNINKVAYCSICKMIKGTLKNRSRHFLTKHDISNVYSLFYYRTLKEQSKKQEKMKEETIRI